LASWAFITNKTNTFGVQKQTLLIKTIFLLGDWIIKDFSCGLTAFNPNYLVNNVVSKSVQEMISKWYLSFFDPDKNEPFNHQALNIGQLP
jgi:hypothetical protein